jgi:adenylate cyclase
MCRPRLSAEGNTRSIGLARFAARGLIGQQGGAERFLSGRSRAVQMSIQDDVKNQVAAIVTVPWDERDGNVVPTTESVKLRDGMVKVTATYLYADLANSTDLAHKVNPLVVARVIRAFLDASARIIKSREGSIRSFDGDRVMGIYVGSSKNSNAARTALAINWAMTEVIRPRLKEKWPDLFQYWSPGHGVGVATGEARMVRGGVRNDNDLVSVGEAPNVAAKLSELRTGGVSFIAESVYSVLDEHAWKSNDGRNMWAFDSTRTFGGKAVKVYSSTWWKTP